VRVLFQHGPLGEPHSSSSIRLLQPFRQPAFRAVYDVSFGATLGSARPDIVIVERLVSQDMTIQRLEALLAEIRQTSARLIYTLDDNLVDAWPTHRWVSSGEAEAQLMVRHLIRSADGVVVSTDALARRLTRFDTPIRVVRNAVDTSMLAVVAAEPPATAADRPRRVIGYMGTRTHDDDLMMIRQALRSVLARHSQSWEVRVVGALGDARLMAAFARLPARLGGPAVKLTYPSFMAWAAEHMRWDIGIAPLVDNALTRCKSDMKYLDYGALGIPGIYSQVPPYATVRHRETGWLTPNTTEGWIEALEALIGDADLRSSLARNAHADVCASRSMGVCACEWIAALRAFQGVAA
jgi:glycosyltransferase involved in cell wall biosynthesis